MAVASESQGTQTAVIGTEHSLATPSSAGVRVLLVDLSNMAAGDAVILRVKVAALTSGTQRVVYTGSRAGAQPADDIMLMSVPVASEQGATFTLQQVRGTGRNFPWKVMTL